MLNNTMPIILLTEPQKRGILLLCVYLFPVILTSLLFLLVISIGKIDLNIINHQSKYASIDTPKNRSAVNKQFQISGSLKTPIPDHSYYLVEYRDKRYWPKYALGNKAISWNKALTHRAKQHHFSNYQIIMVNPTLKKTIDLWFKKSEESGQYLGIADLPLKHIVANIRIKSL